MKGKPMKKLVRKGVHKGVTLLVMSFLVAIIAKLLPRVMSHEKFSQVEEKVDSVIDVKAEQAKDLTKKGAHKTFTLIENISIKDDDEKTKIS